MLFSYRFGKYSRLAVCLILAAAILAGCAAPVRLETFQPPSFAPTSEPTPTPAPEVLPAYVPSPAVRGDKRLSEIVYERPDPEAYRQRVDEFIEAFKAAPGPKEQLDLYLDIEAYAREVSDMLILAEVRYMSNVNEQTQAEYDYASSFYSKVQDCEVNIYRAILDSPYLAQMEEYLGENVLSDMRRSLRDFDFEIVNLREQARKCNSEYIRIVREHKDAGILIQGEKMDADAVLDEMYGLSEKDARYGVLKEGLMAYYDDLNRKCDGVYAQLLDANTRIATLAGFASYPAYRLDERSYSLEEIRKFIGNVKDTMTPVMQKLIEQGEAALGGPLTSELYYAALCPPYLMIDETYYDPDDAEDVAEDKEYAAAREVLMNLLPEAGEVIDYLERMEMIDVRSSSVKSAGGFSAFFYGLAQPYIYAEKVDADTFIHETGHALNSYSLPAIDIPSRFSVGTEISEVHSMGLQTLAQRHYGILYGESAEYAVLSTLFEGVHRMLTQSMYYEFELECYDNSSMTRDERNALYARLSDEYLLSVPGMELYGDSGLNWVSTPHHFEAPLYTVDYALAQMVCFELWEVQESDPARAMELYLNFLYDNQTLTLNERLENAGFTDVFDRQNMQAIADKLTELFSGEKYMGPLSIYIKYLQRSNRAAA